MEISYSEIVELVAQNNLYQLVFLKNTSNGTYYWSNYSYRQLGIQQMHKEEADVWSYLLYSDDYDAFMEQLRMLEDGQVKKLDCVFRIRKSADTFNRCSFTIWKLSESNDCLVGVIKETYNARTIDFVTKLPYSDSFRSSLTSKLTNQQSGAILLFGIDDFKRINDLYSYSFGDKVLRHFSILVQAIFPENVEVFRLDGDNFGVIMIGMAKNEILKCYNQMQHMVQQPHEIANISLTLTISGGLCFFPNDGMDCETLYRNARIALRYAKQKGKNQLIVYSEGISQVEQYNMRLFEKLRDSIRLGYEGFSLHYQPLIHSESGSLYGCEALLRWESPDFPEGVSPYQFIPVLESSGLILEVGRWVIDHAMKQCEEWARVMPDFQMNINVSCKQFENPTFQFYVIETLAKYNLDPELITLELTESGQIIDSETVRDAFDFLRSQRIKIAFDDFGTGYASLGIFRILSADELKIDRSFLERISYDITDQKIIGQIIHLCHSMNMKVCVEGIESEEMERIIQQLGADIMQGYYYGKPLTANEFTSIYFTNQIMEEERGNYSDVNQSSLVLSNSLPVQSLSLAEIVDNAHAGIFQVGLDQEFTFLTCNEGYRRMLGYTTKEINEKFKNRALGFVHPDDMAYVNNEIRRQLGKGDTITIEFRIIRSDGESRWILGTGNVVKSKNGKPSLIVNIIENNKLKLHSLEIEDKYAKYCALMNNIPTGIKCVRLDADYTIEYISPSFISLLGYTEQEIFSDFDGKLINLIFSEDLSEIEKDIDRQLPYGDVVTMRYRCVCKDGHLIWFETISRINFNEEDGIPRSYSSVVDLSDTLDEKNNNKDMNLASRYQRAVSQWGDILFEYHFENDRVSFSDNYVNLFGRFPKLFLADELKYIVKEDQVLLEKVFQSIKQGIIPEPIDIRIEKANHEVIWCSVVLSAPETDGNQVLNVIGKIMNIDEDKKEYNQLLQQSIMDGMMDILNKGATEQKIREILSKTDKTSSYALYIIDIDNFKQINDYFGHLTGDQVLRTTALRLKTIFSSSDIIGRAGGDEFIVFTPFVGDKQNVLDQAELIKDKLSEDIQVNKDICAISVSIGIACYPTHATEFLDLFSRADSALYRAKALGKNRFCLVNE